MNGKLSLQIITLLAWFLLASCQKPMGPESSSPNREANTPEELTDLPARLDLDRKIDLVASLHSYSENHQLLHDLHRISALEILEPDRYSDKGLLIKHSQSPSSDSDWRKTGAVFRIRIAEDLLDWIVDGIGFIGTQDVEIIDELTIIPAGLDSGFTHTGSDSRSICWRDLVAKFGEHQFDGLSENEQAYFLVRIADAVARSGGFHEIWKSPLGEYSSRFAYAFAIIGAGTKAGLFEEFDKMIASAGQPKGVLQRETAHSQLTAAELAAIDELGIRYASDHVAVDQLLDRWAETIAICKLTE